MFRYLWCYSEKGMLTLKLDWNVYSHLENIYLLPPLCFKSLQLSYEY